MRPYFDLHCRREGDKYILEEPIVYSSPRYQKTLTCPKGMRSDGASGPAEDILSIAWWVHDRAWSTWKWDDGSPLSLWQSTMILHDILYAEDRWFRAASWPIATYGAGLWNRLWKRTP